MPSLNTLLLFSLAVISVLFVCTHNSARSQMAEGLLRARHGDRFEALSAGTAPTRVNRLAVAAMAELGIDIGSQRSKTVEEAVREPVDVVVTVCDNARESCPYVPARRLNLHRPFVDPSASQGNDRERLESFRQVRDTIAVWLEELVGELEGGRGVGKEGGEG